MTLPPLPPGNTLWDRPHFIYYTAAQMREYAAAAVAAEREACALTCEGISADDKTGYGIADDCAAVIRARGEQG